MKRRISPFRASPFHLFLFASLLSGCAIRSVYVPTVGNEHLYDQKKQIQAKGYAGTTHAEVLVGGNPIDHLAVGTNLSFGKGLAIYEGHIGIYGYSKDNLPAGQAGAKWRYEVFGGVNSTRNFLKQSSVWVNVFKEEKSNYVTESLYNKYFFQLSFGYFSKMEIYKINYSFSISCRTSYIDFKKYIYKELHTDSTLLMNSPVYIVNKEFHNKDLFLLEPCITNKVGIKNVSAILQGQFMIPYSKEIDIRHTKFSPVFIFSIGFQYTFIFKKQKDPSK